MIELTEQERETGLIYLALLPEQAEELNRMLVHRGMTISPPAPKDEGDRDWRVLTFTEETATAMAEVPEGHREVYRDLVEGED